MKKISLFAVMLVLTLSLLTGCGCTRRGAVMDTVPATEMTIMPTNIPETTAPVMPSTEPATRPATEPTAETGIMGTEDAITGETGARSRTR